MPQTTIQIAAERPKFLVEPPSITQQTDWPCAFYELPDTWRDLPATHFNCGLVAWKGNDWLITRTQTRSGRRKFMSCVVFWPLDKAGKVLDGGTQLMKAMTFADEQVEDPRGFVDDAGRLWVSLTCWRNAVPGNYAHQVFGEVNEHFEMAQPQHICYGRNTNHLLRQRGYEKNWVWFQGSNGLPHFVYTIRPHTVCQVHPEGIKEHKTIGDHDVWDYGEPRGGTPPVLVGNDYFSFFHSSRRWFDPYRRYFMGCYAFTAEPETHYALSGITPYPLLFASEQDPREGPSPIVVFPCGALFRDDVWTVSFGCNDCRSAWIRVPHADLVERMVAL